MPTSTLSEPAVRDVLDRLHSHDRRRRLDWLRAAVPSVLDEVLRRRRPASERARRDRKLALGLTPAAGRMAYLTARAIRARRIVEFGTSLGLSTVYLASAVRDNGGGTVIGSELEPSKVEKAMLNVAAAGLSEYVHIRAGDARTTLADPGGEVDMLLLDGAKELYISVLEAVEPHLRPGAVVLADDVILFKRVLAPYSAFVQDKANGFESATLSIGGGLEYSVRL